MKNQDTRWVQRLNNYQKAFKQLESGVEFATDKDLNDLEKEGLIQRFEYTQELAWKVIKDFYQSIGNSNIQGSSDAFRQAVHMELIDDKTGIVLLASIQSRNDTVHTYNKETANKIFRKIIDEYYSAFLNLKNALEKEQKERNL